MTETELTPENVITFLSNKLISSGCYKCLNREIENLNFYHSDFSKIKTFYDLLNERRFFSLDEIEGYIKGNDFSVRCIECIVI